MDDKFNIKRLATGMFGSNSYIIWKNKKCIMIDAGVEADEIIKVLTEEDIELEYIILTHGHIDHICSIDNLRMQTLAKVIIHVEDACALTDSLYNGSALFGSEQAFKAADKLVRYGDIIEADGLKLEVIHTPGHSQGCICLKTEDIVFTGDTLFKGSIGRTDLGNGNFTDIINSINTRLMTIDDGTVVYPGHGPSTTIGYEKRNNPFLK